MQDEAGKGTASRSDGRHDGYDSIISDLVSTIERVETSIKLIEAAIARESAFGDQETASAVVVLDDVAPLYTRADAALNACKAGLHMAVHLLTEARISRTGIEATAGRLGVLQRNHR